MATINAASTSLADVQTAIDSASTGDTVTIPAGDSTWGASATYLSVNKAITLQGAGQGQTNITLSDSGPTWSSGTIRITAAATVKSMTIIGSNAAAVCAFSVGTTNNWRITDIDFNGGSTEAYFAYVGEVYGLIDNNDVAGGSGSSELIFVRGPTDSWQTAHSIGGANNVFIEDNTFSGSGYICDANSNARVVVRYNTITGPMKVDGHGKASNTPARGVRHMEIYENTWNYSGESNYWRYMEIRGGTGRIFNNVVTAVGKTLYLVMQEYGCLAQWSNFDNQYQCPADYPIDDQVGVGVDPKSAASEPFYIWNNTLNGSQVSAIAYEGIPAGATSYCDEGTWTMADIIQEDRDYFISESQPEAISGYSAYTYPHPLQSGTVSSDFHRNRMRFV